MWKMCLGVLAPLSCIPAQVLQLTATATALTPLTTTATGTQTQTSSVPAGTPVTSGLLLQASGGSGVSASLDVSLANDPLRYARLAINESSLSTGLPGGIGSAGCGSHEILLQLTANIAIAGRLRMHRNVGGIFGSCNFEIDLNADGTFEYQDLRPALPGSPPIDVELPLTLGPVPFLLRTRTSSSCATGGSLAYASSSSTIEFVPDSGCSSTTLGGSCGLLLTVTENTRRGVTAQVDFLGPTASHLAVLAIGSQQLGLTLPWPPGCAQLTDPGVLIPLVPGATGAAAIGLDGAALPRPLTAFLQAVELDLAAGTASATALSRVSCQ